MPQVRTSLNYARHIMRDGAYKLTDTRMKVLGYVLIRKGVITSFTPHGLRVAELNSVFDDIREGRLDGYTLKPVGEIGGPSSDTHSFYVSNTNRKEAWKHRKEAERRRHEIDPEELEKEAKKLEKKLLRA